MISPVITSVVKNQHKGFVLKSNQYHKHALRFCKSKCHLCSFIKTRPLLKEVDMILYLLWHMPYTEKNDIKCYDSARKLVTLLNSYAILSTLNTQKEHWYHYVISEIVTSYLRKYNWGRLK